MKKYIIHFVIIFGLILGCALPAFAATLKTADGIKYLVAENGEQSPYTGWTKTASGKRYYYSDGVRLTGVQVMEGFAHVFDYSGEYMGRRDMSGKFVLRFGKNQTVSSDAEKFEPVLICNDETIHPRDYYVSPAYELYYYDQTEWKRIGLPVAFDDYAVGFKDQPPFEVNLPLNKDIYDFEFVPGLYRAVVTITWADRLYPYEDSALRSTILVTNEFSIR
jgi:hypothetical protein